MRFLALAALALALAASGCGEDEAVEETTASPRERTSGGESSPEYGAEARAAYEKALLEFRDGNCLKAEPAFRKIRREYPYSRFAALAELRIGDCQFEEKGYAEGIETYRAFIRYRPSHAQVPYARFRMAEGYFKQIPREWLLSPPTHERDQTPAHDALRQLQRFVRDFPDDDRVPAANRMIRQTLGVLARHELYAARFYRRLDSEEAAIRRLELLLDRYEGSGHDAEALLLLGEIRADLDQTAEAREAYTRLVERFPESEEAADARKRLRSMPAPAAPRRRAAPPTPRPRRRQAPSSASARPASSEEEQPPQGQEGPAPQAPGSAPAQGAPAPQAPGSAPAQGAPAPQAPAQSE